MVMMQQQHERETVRTISVILIQLWGCTCSKMGCRKQSINPVRWCYIIWDCFFLHFHIIFLYLHSTSKMTILFILNNFKTHITLHLYFTSPSSSTKFAPFANLLHCCYMSRHRRIYSTFTAPPPWLHLHFRCTSTFAAENCSTVTALHLHCTFISLQAKLQLLHFHINK